MSPPDKDETTKNEARKEAQKEKESQNHTGDIIFPIAPKPSFENSEQIGISSTPAFQCVDDVSCHLIF